MVNLNDYLEEIKEGDTHTKKVSKKASEAKSKVFTFYIKGEDIETLENLIENHGDNKVGEFLRKTIEKQYNIKFIEEYDRIGRRPKK